MPNSYTNVEVRKKMIKIRALTDAILRAEEDFKRSPSYKSAQQVQHLKKQRKELQGLLPPLKLISVNTEGEANE